MDSTPVIPIFPLPLVQFPGALTPLHIFEPRYRQLLRDVTEGDKTFGISLRAEHVASRPPLGSVGCTVEIAVVQQLPDGRANILCVGGQRYRLVDYIEGGEYLRAEIELFDDEPNFDDLSDDVRRAKLLFERLIKATRKLHEEADRGEAETPDLPDDPTVLSFIIAAHLDLENDEKQQLLELTDTGQRLHRVNELLREQATNTERRAVAHRISKSNGHGGKLPDFPGL